MNDLFKQLIGDELLIIEEGDYVLLYNEVIPVTAKKIIGYDTNDCSISLETQVGVKKVGNLKWMSKSIYKALKLKDAQIVEYQTTILNQYNMLNLIEAKLDEHITNKL